MEESIFLELTNKALITTWIIAIPILIPGLITGVLISLFQAVTQISEQTLTFVPKLMVLILSYIITGPFIVKFLSAYTIEIIQKIPSIGNS